MSRVRERSTKSKGRIRAKMNADSRTLAFVRSALSNTSSPEYTFLAQMVSGIGVSSATSTMMSQSVSAKRKALRALSVLASHVPPSRPEFTALIKTFKLSSDREVTMWFLLFCKNLVTTGNTYHSAVIDMAVDNILPRNASGFTCDETCVDYDEKTTNDFVGLLSDFISDLLQLVPLCISLLSRKLQRGLPHYKRNQCFLLTYFNALIVIMHKSNALKPLLLPPMITHLAKIDTTIDIDSLTASSQCECEDNEDSKSVKSDTLASMMFQMAITENESSANIDCDVNKTVDMLDGLMNLLLKYIEYELQVSSESANALFMLFQLPFEKAILSSFKLKFVQFLFFKVFSHNSDYLEKTIDFLLQKSIGFSIVQNVSKSESLVRPLVHRNTRPYERSSSAPLSALFHSETVKPFTAKTPTTLFAPRPLTPAGLLADEFLQSNPHPIALSHSCNRLHQSPPSVLVDQTSMQTQSTVTERIACCYWGGFIARAKMCSIEIIEKVFTLALKWAIDYENNLEIVVADWSLHPFFYQIIQTLCYAFCFVGERIISSLESSTEQWFAENGFYFIATSQLAPLKVCAGSICREFLATCSALGLHSFVNEAKVNQSHCVSTRAGCDDNGVNGIDLYFPFDPIGQLKQTSEHFTEIYNVWQSHEDDVIESE